jgi:radical SAM protein with 4Fe4S-binding SPASM domain
MIPSNIYVELTNMCNLKCDYCFHGNNSMKRPTGFMSKETFETILEQVKEFRPKLTLHLAGESFLHPLLFDFIRIAKIYNLTVGITTNGTIIDKDDFGILKTGIDIINISYVGEKINSNIYGIIEKNNNIKSNTKIYISIVDNMLTKEHKEELKSIWNNKIGVSKFIIRDLMTWGNTVENNINFNFKKKFFSVIKKSDYIMQIYLNLTMKHICNSVYTTAGILWNGDIVPCCLDYDGKLVMGNIKYDNILNIWNGHKMKELRKTLLKVKDARKHPVCGNCRWEHKI